jgi:ATP-dependent helicase/nuclease subunit A
VLTRLGGEADEALDEFLAQVMDAEQRNIRDLEALVADFAALDIIVKREMEGARREVRVMTAHGSKGLEAPIVFLPETTVKRGAGGSPLLTTQDGGVLWSTGKSSDCAASTAARELREKKEAEEALRLYYVALTRARDRLVLCGRIDARTKDENVGGWYAAAKAAFAHADIAPDVREIGDPDAPILRYGPDPGKPCREKPRRWRFRPPGRLGHRPRQARAGDRPLRRPVADRGRGRQPRPGPLAPGQGRGPGALSARRDHPPAAADPARHRPNRAPRGGYAAAGRRARPDRRPAPRDGRRGLRRAGGRAFRRRVRSRFTGRGGAGGDQPLLPKGLAISGRVDRLVVTEGRVLVVDYKTNRPAPATIEDADQAYLAQMAVYVAVLREVFPDRPSRRRWCGRTVPN